MGYWSECTDGADVPDGRLPGVDLDHMAANAVQAASFLKSPGQEQRLMMLCHLASGEKSVGEFEEALVARQAVLSQQLAHLWHEGLVSTRREGKTIHCGLTGKRA